MSNQPNFITKANAIPGTEYDNLSDEELTKLLNETGRFLNKKPGNFSPSKPPQGPNIVNLDHVFGGLNVN
jgi:hypothetical protein